MKILLDTHAALWWWQDSPALAEPAREAIAAEANEIYFSAASGYEIFQKLRLGKLQLPVALAQDLPAAVLAEGWQFLALGVNEAVYAAKMQSSHRDPFDRMLAAQAELKNLSLASRDPFFGERPVHIIW